jgi:NADH:ubiquinone oxidoreductase subunit
MGFDFQNQHVFVGEQDAELVRAAIVEYVGSTFAGRSCSEDEAERSIVIGPPGRWIFVGDSAGGTENGDAESFDALSKSLSRIAPTLAIKMSDSAIIHFYLYSKESVIDKFGNGKLPMFLFRNSDEASQFAGDCEKWAALLVDPKKIDLLRRTWSQDEDATSLLIDTAQLFGLHPELCKAGYTIFNESDEIKYSDWLKGEYFEQNMFDEFHFSVS